MRGTVGGRARCIWHVKCTTRCISQLAVCADLRCTRSYLWNRQVQYSGLHTGKFAAPERQTMLQTSFFTHASTMTPHLFTPHTSHPA
jgi:hypothetical protein